MGFRGAEIGEEVEPSSDDGMRVHAPGLLRVGGVTYGTEDETVHLIQPIERRLWQGVSVLQIAAPAHGKALESYIKPRLTSDSRFHNSHRPGYDLQTYVVPFHHTDSVLHMRLSIPLGLAGQRFRRVFCCSRQ